MLDRVFSITREQMANPDNLIPFKPGNKAHRPSPWPERALGIARRHTVEAVKTAIACMQDIEAPWPERLAAIKIILAEGLPKKRDAFEALFAAAASGEGFIEVRFVDPGREPKDVTPANNGHDTIRIEYDAE